MGSRVSKVQKFSDLTAWQEAHRLVLSVYKTTSVFPKSEQFVLVPQIRRAAISITSNIAEGFSRQGRKEKTQFYFIAKASLTELYNQYILAKDLHYVSEKEFEVFHDQATSTGKLLTGLIKFFKT